MRNLFETDGGIYTGYVTDKPKGEPPRLEKPLLYTGDRGIITLGPSGSGKTRRSLLINVTRLVGWSKVIVDPKGIICRMCMQHLKDAGNDVIVLNPHGVLDIASNGCNPIATMGGDPQLTDEFPDDAMQAAEANIQIEGKEPHFPQGAQDLSAGILMWIRLMLANGSYEDFRRILSLNDKEMKAFVSSKDFEHNGKRYLGAIEAGKKHGWPEIGIKTGRFADISPDNKEQHGVISTGLTQTRYIDSRPIRRDLKGPKIDFRVLRKKPTTVFIILPPNRIVTHAPWVRLILTNILQDLMRDTRDIKVPTLLAIDEYPAFARDGGFPLIERNLPMMREYGLMPWILAQGLPQIQRCHPQDWETIMGNAGICQYFAPQELTTSKWVSEICGQATATQISASQQHQKTAGQPASKSESVSVSQIPIPLMLPQDIRAMHEGFTLVTSYKVEGPFFSYLPYPTELKHMKHIMALDPSV